VTQRTDLVDVKIENQVLWIGTDAYPLRNVTATRRHVIEADRRGSVKSFVKSVLALFVAMVISVTAGETFSQTLKELAPGVSVLVFLILVIVLVKRLRTPDVHVLSIETPSTAETVIASTDWIKVHALNKQITEAISDPNTEFHVQIENVHIGDKITQHGGYNIGKQAG
jgi:hypothetical protein